MKVNYFECAALDMRKLDRDARTIRASLSSDAPIETFFGRQKLDHSDAAIDMTRAAQSLPLLFNHNPDRVIGRVENVRSDGHKLSADLRFSSGEDGERALSEIADGILRDVSIGFRMQRDTVDLEAEPGTAIVRNWTPHEASIVAVPADHTVGVNRSLFEDQNMDTKDPNVIELDRARKAGAAAERERATAITAAFKLANVENPALFTRMIDEDKTIAEVNAELLAEVGKRNAGNITTGGYVQPGEDEGEKANTAMELALLARAGYALSDDEKRSLQGNEFHKLTCREMARASLQRAGLPVRGQDSRYIVGEALVCRSTIGLSTSDFANILSNTANKFLLTGFEMEAGTTWRTISRSINLPDFKQADLATLGAFPNLEEVPAGSEFKYGTVGDRKEVIKLLTYGKLFALTRQAIINDDLNAFSDIPRKMGRAADRRINQLVYGVLTANAALNQDAVALFDAGHSNLGTAGAISVTTVDEMRVLMAVQTDSADANADGMNTDLAMLIVPKELEGRANTLRVSQHDPIGFTGGVAGAVAANPEQGRWSVVADALLSADDAAQWYGSADPNLADTLLVGFLDGQSEPFLETETAFSKDGTIWKVRIDAAAIAGDFRGLTRNAGP